MMVDQRFSPSVRSADVDPDAFHDFASNAVLAADRLSAEGQPSRLRQVQSGDWAFDMAEVNSRLNVEGSLGADHLAVVVVLRGADSTICGFPLRENTVLLLPQGTGIAASARPGLCYHAATLSSAVWADICHNAVGLDTERLGATIEAFDLGAFGRTIRDTAGQIATRLTSMAGKRDETSEPPAVLVDYIGAVVQACVPSRGVRLDRSLRHRMQQARQAQDFIRSHLHEEISVLRLCKELRVSRRQLEYAFRTAFEVAPKEFIQLMRLNESRRLMMVAGKRGLSVTDVAMEVGVNHLGRFSARYRQLFGETPRVTLARGHIVDPPHALHRNAGDAHI